MSRYARMFEHLASRGEGAFGAFLMLGDPDAETSAELLDAVVEAGADMVEVGIPFSDPVADGPVIQAAAQRALAAGVRTAECFEMIASFRRRHPQVPLGILTYSNLVMAPGREAFFGRAADAGADSLLVADLPAFEAEPWAVEMRAVGLDPVLIAAANTPPETLRTVARLGSGYTYCVTRAGITGNHAAAEFDTSMLTALQELRAPPPVFGFGISTPAHVRAALAAGASGVISGSAIVSAVAEGRDVGVLIASLKSATRNDSAPS
ncbi:MAG: tryptophan synthase subunit alpha [Pseudomonadota bacterium]|nr:tryptophan synthase subunit alpha [Pseudomonadota bacterium]